MLWMKGSYDEAQTKLHAACEFNARINFSQGAFTSQLYLIEMACDLNDIAEAERLFAEIDQAEVDALNSLAVLGHLRIVTGRLALIKGQFEEAIQALQQAISIFDLNSCIYPRGLASFYLADAYRQLGRLQEAREEMDVANKHFTTMRARPMLERVEQWLANLRLETRSRDIAQTIETRSNAEALTRLIGATASRELLLHELAKVLHQDFEIPIVVIYEKDKTNLPKLLAFEGCQLSKAVRMIESWRGDVIILKPGKESPVFVALSKSVGREFNLQTALKTVEMGLELYALRRKLPIIADYERGYEENEIRLPGMVYSSAAMRDVAEQIYKIHGSKMAVLVTGESGTGK
ncbi:MAG TPA: hypothetical protein VEF04_03670, partial [Blastocatellia bacterium]|nr:hypothetical protein [Blastocatellia bacterium]